MRYNMTWLLASHHSCVKLAHSKKVQGGNRLCTRKETTLLAYKVLGPSHVSERTSAGAFSDQQQRR